MNQLRQFSLTQHAHSIARTSLLELGLMAVISNCTLNTQNKSEERRRDVAIPQYSDEKRKCPMEKGYSGGFWLEYSL